MQQTQLTAMKEMAATFCLVTPPCAPAPRLALLPLCSFFLCAAITCVQRAPSALMTAARLRGRSARRQAAQGRAFSAAVVQWPQRKPVQLATVRYGLGASSKYLCRGRERGS